MRQLFESYGDKGIYNYLLSEGETIPKKLFQHIMQGPPEKVFGPKYRSAVQHLRDLIGFTNYEGYIETVRSPEFKELLKP